LEHSLSAEPIRAQLYNSDEAIALGIVARAHAPVLALCRKLVAAGYDPATPLHAYRGAKLALRVRSIGEGARLVIRGDGTGYRLAPSPSEGLSEADRADSVRFKARAIHRAR
jgi:hypothetical protein